MFLLPCPVAEQVVERLDSIYHDPNPGTEKSYIRITEKNLHRSPANIRRWRIGQRYIPRVGVSDRITYVLKDVPEQPLSCLAAAIESQQANVTVLIEILRVIVFIAHQRLQAQHVRLVCSNDEGLVKALPFSADGI